MGFNWNDEFIEVKECLSLMTVCLSVPRIDAESQSKFSMELRSEQLERLSKLALRTAGESTGEVNSIGEVVVFKELT